MRSTRSPRLRQLVVGIDDREPGADRGLVQHPPAARPGGLPERLAHGAAARERPLVREHEVHAVRERRSSAGAVSSAVRSTSTGRVSA